MKVGFVGFGPMGGPMGRNVLAAGHELVVHDIRRQAAARSPRMNAASRVRLVSAISLVFM